MSNLFEKLMEEAERVNALNVEVDKIVEQHEKEVEDWRLGKRRHIGEFLSEVSKAFSTAKYPSTSYATLLDLGNVAVTFKNGSRGVCQPVVEYSDGLRIRIRGAGGYLTVPYRGTPELSTSYGASMMTEAALDSVTDMWKQSYEEIITEKTTKILKAWLAKRVDTMGDALKEASRRVGE